jgi:adenosine deaminase
MNYISPFLCFLGLFFFSAVQAGVQSYFEHIKKDPNALYAFFKSMPKGGELHYHLSGGAYPETMLELASKGDYCLNTSTWMINKNSTECNGINTKNLTDQPEIYAKTVNNWSMKNFVAGEESGHDHFFSTFYKFNTIIEDYQPELVADVLQVAAQQNEHYMELMVLPDNGRSIKFGDLLKNTSSWNQKRTLLLANRDFKKNITYTELEANRILKQAHQNLGCDTNPEKGPCKIKVKFLYFSLREQSLNNFFAQTLNAFEAVAQSQKKHGPLIGVNLVQPEAGIISLRDYHQHMQLYHYFHQIYPQVNISLHAGEITQEIVPPKELDYHIHDALFIGQAQRIGHGVDIAYENNMKDSLDYMATQHKAVEINLISNLKILNVSGTNHPLNYYLQHHVPVVLSTDDEGILRTNLSSQYVEATLGHGLDYQTLKQINRNTLTYAFLPGRNIWSDANKAQLTHDCQDLNSNSCKEFIKASEKAQLQWNLEKDLHDFEEQFENR